jgi:GDP-4-dehydro-6-deoxy-D-mannose reductase
MDIVMTRSFNHCGPGQSARFAVSSFGRSFAYGIRKKEKSIVLPIGNIDVVRDFLDVRDVIEAYELILKGAERGETYNVCSGRGVSLRNIIKRFAKLASISVETEIHGDRIRIIDNDYVVGSHDAITKAVGWAPTIALDTRLSDVLGYWTQNLDL